MKATAGTAVSGEATVSAIASLTKASSHRRRGPGGGTQKFILIKGRENAAGMRMLTSCLPVRRGTMKATKEEGKGV